MNSLTKDIENSSVVAEKCNYFIFSKNLNGVVSNKNLELNKSDIYVFPEISNIICLGKVGYIEKNDSSYNGTIYTNTKFINYLIIGIEEITYYLNRYGYFFLDQLYVVFCLVLIGER